MPRKTRPIGKIGLGVFARHIARAVVAMREEAYREPRNETYIQATAHYEHEIDHLMTRIYGDQWHTPYIASLEELMNRSPIRFDLPAGAPPADTAKRIRELASRSQADTAESAAPAGDFATDDPPDPGDDRARES